MKGEITLRMTVCRKKIDTSLIQLKSATLVCDKRHDIDCHG